MPWHAMAEGLMPVPDAVRDVVKMVVGQEVEELMADHGYARTDTEPHTEEQSLCKRYKAVLEKLRNMPHMEAVRQIDRYFRGLTPEYRGVLVQLLKRPSIARLADAEHMSPDKFAEIKHDLQNFLTN